MAEKYGDDRRTQIAHEAKEELADEDLVENKPVLISITQRGYIKRTLQEKYRAQTRGSVGAKGAELREEDAVQYLFLAHSLDTILFFSDKGKVYSERAYQITEGDRADRGIALAQIINVAPGENITASVAVPDFGAADYCTMVTRKGKIKRVVLSEFAQVRPSGLIATNLEEGDVLGWVKLTLGGQDIILVTKKGQAARYNEDEVRAMGRTATGVNAIKLAKGDFITSMEVVDPEADLLVVSEKGYGKRTPLSEYAAKSRAIGGVATIAQRHLDITGDIASARVVRAEDEITIITTNGLTLRLKVADIRQSSRSTMGTRLMNLKEGDTVASVARLAAKDLAAVPEEKREEKAKAEGESIPAAEVDQPEAGEAPTSDAG
jgi:DNA gyrase subunit A